MLTLADGKLESPRNLGSSAQARFMASLLGTYASKTRRLDFLKSLFEFTQMKCRDYHRKASFQTLLHLALEELDFFFDEILDYEYPNADRITLVLSKLLYDSMVKYGFS